MIICSEEYVYTYIHAYMYVCMYVLIARYYICQVIHSLCGYGSCRAPQLRLQAREEPLAADERWLRHQNQHQPEVVFHVYCMHCDIVTMYTC